MFVKEVLFRLLRPLSSRKVRIAMATVAVAMVAEFGVHIGQEMMLTVIGISVALILGIAHEDAGHKAGGKRNQTRSP